MINVGMTKRDGSCGPARGPLVKNVRQTDFFNPLTHISPQPARASSGAGRDDPLTRKKKKLALSRQRNYVFTKFQRKKPNTIASIMFMCNVFELMFMFMFNVLEVE